MGWATRLTTFEGHWKRGVMGRVRNLASVASYASTRGIFYVREAWHSSNTVPTNGLRPGFPHYDPGIPGAFTAEGIPLSTTRGRTWLLCGSSRLPRVNTSRQEFKKILRKIQLPSLMEYCNKLICINCWTPTDVGNVHWDYCASDVRSQP